MLYFYKSIPKHQMENMHTYMHHFFEQLFAEKSVVYDQAVHIHSDFRNIINKYNDKIENRLKIVYTNYMALDSLDKQIVQNAYNNNNDIEGICNNIVRPYKYNELPLAIQSILIELYGSEGVLYKMLTSKNAYTTIKKRCGSLKSHFETFRAENKISVCPFCGMENLITEHEHGKNEYDHYLSKGDYPFCSINFKNLAPICDYCNKAENKGQKDIPFVSKLKPQIQEELFYPYSTAYPDHEITLTINSKSTDLNNIENWTLTIDCTPAKNYRKKCRWVEIFNIESRYKGKIAGDSYSWKDTIVSEYNRQCKKRGDPFNNFKDDMLATFQDYKKWNNGIHMKTFREFIMNNPDCEDFLSGNIRI